MAEGEMRQPWGVVYTIGGLNTSFPLQAESDKGHVDVFSPLTGLEDSLWETQTQHPHTWISVSIIWFHRVLPSSLYEHQVLVTDKWNFSKKHFKPLFQQGCENKICMYPVHGHCICFACVLLTTAADLWPVNILLIFSWNSLSCLIIWNLPKYHLTQESHQNDTKTYDAKKLCFCLLQWQKGFFFHMLRKGAPRPCTKFGVNTVLTDVLRDVDIA